MIQEYDNTNSFNYVLLFLRKIKLKFILKLIIILIFLNIL